MSFRTPAYRVLVNGTDYTSRFQPLTKSISVSDRAGLSSDKGTIVLADVDGRIRMPQEGDKLQIWLGDSKVGVGLVFSGFIDEIRSSGSKGGGRELQLGASGVDPKSEARAAKELHADDTTFGDAAKQFAKEAGVNDVSVAQELASIQGKYWAMQNESFMHWGQRIAREIDATFKMQDGRAIFVPINGGKTAGGQPLPTITGTYGDNLLTWEISPIVSRPRHGKVRARYYDTKDAKWKEHEVEVEGGNYSAIFTDRQTSGTEERAKTRANTLKSRAERNAGEGSVAIVGDANAKPEGIFVLAGARSGIDGQYRIDGVDHRLTKQGGYVTSLELKQPAGGAGSDTRSAQ